MLLYGFKRILLGIPTLLGILLLNFLLLKALPGTSMDYLDMKASGGKAIHAPSLVVGEGIDGASLGSFISKPLVSEPSEISLWEEVKTFLCNYSHLDLGWSHVKGRSVSSLIKDRLWISLWLGFTGFVVSAFCAFFLARLVVRRPGSFLDSLITWVGVIVDACPSFLFSFLILLILGGRLFPLGGLHSDHWETFSWIKQMGDTLYHLVLPWFCILMGGMVPTLFLIRTVLREEMSKRYIQGIYARGGTERQVFSHLRPSVVLAVLGCFPSTFMGLFLVNTLVVEMIFSLEGMGLLIWQSVIERDYPVLMGSFFTTGCLGLALQILSDLVCAFLDPRIHFKGKVSR